MRELTLIETGYFAGLLVLSLVMPLMVSSRGVRSVAAKRNCVGLVWIAQVILALGAIGVLASTTVALYALVLALVGWSWCLVAVRRQLSIAV